MSGVVPLGGVQLTVGGVMASTKVAPLGVDMFMKSWEMLLEPPLTKVTRKPAVSPDETVLGVGTTDDPLQPGFEAVADPMTPIDKEIASARALKRRGILRFICLTTLLGFQAGAQEHARAQPWTCGSVLVASR